MLFEVTPGMKSRPDLALHSVGQGWQESSRNWDRKQSVRPNGGTDLTAWAPAHQSGQGTVKCGRGQADNNTIGCFLELYIFIRGFPGIEKFHASFIDDDTETNSNYMTYPTWQCCQSQGLVTTAVLRACILHHRPVYRRSLDQG